MKLLIKFISLTFLILIFGLYVSAQTFSWVGKYKFVESGGKTAGGSVIFIEHTLDIAEKDGKLDAHFFSNGFQTSRDVYADGKIDGDKLMLYYRDEGEKNFTSEYKKGELLLTLERKIVSGKTKILTYWNAFFPVIEKSEKSGEVYFEKTEVKKESADVKWTQIKTANGEFSMLLPEGFTSFFDKEGFKLSKSPTSRKEFEFSNLRALTGYYGGVSMWFESYDVKNADKAFPLYLAHSMNNWRDSKVADYKLENTLLRKIYYETDVGYSADYYFHSGERVYHIGFGTRDKSNKNVSFFLSSVLFMDKSLFTIPTEKPTLSGQALVLESLTTTPIEVTYAKDWDKNNKKDQTVEKKDQTVEKSEEKSEVKSLFILNMTRPEYTDRARVENIAGIISIKTTFGENGQIQALEVINGLKEGLTESAIKTARRIRFLPPEKDNEPYSITKTVQFSFSIY